MSSRRTSSRPEPSIDDHASRQEPLIQESRPAGPSTISPRREWHPQEVLHLQRLVGNQKVMRLLGRGPAGVVQRELDWHSHDLTRQAKRVDFGTIPAALDAYWSTTDPVQRGQHLDTLIAACRTWLSLPANSGPGLGNSLVEALLSDARQERRQLPPPPTATAIPTPPGSTPTTVPTPPGSTPTTVPTPPGSTPTTVPTPPGSTPTATPTTTVPVSPYVSAGTLDEGSKLLKDLMARRPQIVNNAADVGSNSALSNCALATLAAIVGDKTSGDVSIQWQQRFGGRTATTSQTPDSALQSEKMWAMQMLPADVARLEAEGFILALDKPEFPEGKAYVIGDAQYYGMLSYLLQLAGERSTGNVQYKVYQHGEPGNQMFPETALLAAMNAYPNGTQFAVFVYSPTPGQQVGAHWVYAEKFDNNVIFADYQKNVSEAQLQKKGGFKMNIRKAPTTRTPFPHQTPAPGVKPADAYLNMFPLSPHSADVIKALSFATGMFVAFAPVIGTNPPPAIDPEVSEAEITAILNGVKQRVAILRESRGLGGTQNKLPTQWTSGTPRMQLEIPSPRLIDQEIRTLASEFGVTATCELGHLNDPDKIRIMGHPQIQVTATSPNGGLVMQNLNRQVHVIGETGAEIADKSQELPTSADPSKQYPNVEVGESFQAALQNTATISAQVTNQGIVFNAYLAAFTDIIHEGLHTFERGGMPLHIKEGLTEIFASLVAERIHQRGHDARYTYAYNPSYAHYVVAANQLIDLFGLAEMARFYFTKERGTATPVADKLQQMLAVRFPAASQDVLGGLAFALAEPTAFPAGFQAAMQQITTLGAGAAPAALDSGKAGELASHQRRFAAFQQERQHGLVTSGALGPGPGNRPDLTGETDPMKLAERDIATISHGENEKLLIQLYHLRDQARGKNYVDASERIFNLENNVMKWTGETRQQVRERLVQPIEAKFQVTGFPLSGTEKVYVVGPAAELGGDDDTHAIPLLEVRPGVWETSLDLFFKRNSALAYRVLVKEAGTVKRTLATANVTLAAAPKATLSTNSTGTTVV